MFGQAVLRRLLDNMGHNSPFELYSFRCMKTEVAFGKKAGSGQVITSLQGPSGAFGGLEPVQIIYTLKKKKSLFAAKIRYGYVYMNMDSLHNFYYNIQPRKKKLKKKPRKIWFCCFSLYTKRGKK